ncbi:MAG: helix-turn-helix transcriptional regulator [Candidatus Marinimicrobia bacterium]|nr:helix-turn-helix transcriptional regulator [Candidatus Neomarinimicrobiota bacterium]
MDNNKFILDDFNPPAIARGIAERMKAFRISQNVTQATLAHRSGVSLGSIKRFESQYKISLANLLRIAQVLEALEAFHHLFPTMEYRNMDDLLKSKQKHSRKRARNV